MKELELLASIHRLVKNRRTGTPQELAIILGISRSCFYMYLDKLRDLGAEIYYCKSSRHFRYLNSFEFKVTIETPHMQHVIGGGSQSFVYDVLCLNGEFPRIQENY